MTSFGIRRGTNISHWLSQSPARGAERRSRFTREDAARLAGLGLDHLRLPIDEVQMWSEDGAREPEAWDLLHQGLDWCEAEGMRAVVDLHILRCHYFNADIEGRSLFSDPRAAMHFADLWRDLSRGLRSRPNDRVAYELLNEPVAEDPEDWNRVLRAPYEAIREEEPDRIIAIGSNRWSSLESYPSFRPPERDPNLILVFHFYAPLLFTHYRAPWVKDFCAYEGPIQYPGTPVPEEELKALTSPLRGQIESRNQPFDRTQMEKSLEPALQLARRMKLPLWCNEFGVYQRVPDEIRKAWYQDFLSVLEPHRIAWSNWDFRGGFGLFDQDNHPTAAMDALLG